MPPPPPHYGSWGKVAILLITSIPYKSKEEVVGLQNRHTNKPNTLKKLLTMPNPQPPQIHMNKLLLNYTLTL